MLAAGNLGEKRPNTAQPYSINHQKRRLPGIAAGSCAIFFLNVENLVKGNHNLPGWKEPFSEPRRPRSRSSSVDKFFDTLGRL